MLTGDVIDGRYRLQRRIGEGGMAAVWLAQDERLERPVAIKLLYAANADERALMTEQFLREAKLAASVRHRNVVQILDFGRHDDLPFMVMEALEGESMADRFSRGHRFELAEVVEIALASLQGLAAVHAAGIVHRDVKPENIFLVNDAGGAYPKLLDFGISRVARKEAGLRSAVTTEDGLVLGTPEYMSSEQARGIADLDQRTDLYSLGVVMYEALTGAAPYESENSGDLLVMVIAGQAPPVTEVAPAISPAISDVVARAMSRDREERFATAVEMYEALRAASHDIERGLVLPLVQRHGSSSSQARKSLPHALAHVRSQSPTVRLPPRTSGRAVALGFVGAMLLAASVVYYAVRATQTGEGPRYIVVQSNPSSSPAQPSGVAAAQTNEPEPAPALPAGAPSAPSEAPIKPSPARPVQPKPRAPAAPSEPADASQAVARAFVQQKARVAGCLNQHADAVANTTDLAVRIGLDADGSVREVEVLPDALGASEAGRCIAQAVRVMTFGPQPGPLTVRVPISARRK